MKSNNASAISVRRTILRIGLCVGLAVMMAWLVIASFGPVNAQAQTPLTTPASAVLDRAEDPVVITGANFPAFSGAPLNELVVYAYRGGGWAPVPFQIDEVNISGTYVTSDDGLLGSRDELVFMAGDAGESASPVDWPVDAAARLNPRYAITVTDPLSTSQQAWAYLYRSLTLTRSNVSYITWTYAAQTASALSYTAAFSPTKFVGLSDLFINGRNVDILDRQKTRLGTILGTFNEESLVSTLGPATITLPATGPIRAATNEGDLKAAFYRSSIEFRVTVNSPIAVTSIRSSFDWISPTISGINTYYDSNTPSGVPIDGVPDVISSTPRTNWFQVNGGVTGPGGLVMMIPSVNPGGGAVTNYYWDNGVLDSNDTGDQRSYGDAGLQVTCSFFSPCVGTSFTLMAAILPPGASTNVGAVYYARTSNPLQVNTAWQCYPLSDNCVTVYLPLVINNLTGAQ
jgi:hypothetical protein